MKMRNLVLAMAAALATLPAMAGDIDGKWNATVDSPMGAVNLLLEFKSEGEKLTGSIATDMAGQAMPTTPISDGLVKGEDVTFKLSMMIEGAPPMLINYKGKLKGDELTLVSVFDMGQGPQETQLLAKRAK